MALLTEGVQGGPVGVGGVAHHIGLGPLGVGAGLGEEVLDGLSVRGVPRGGGGRGDELGVGVNGDCSRRSDGDLSDTICQSEMAAGRQGPAARSDVERPIGSCEPGHAERVVPVILSS